MPKLGMSAIKAIGSKLGNKNARCNSYSVPVDNSETPESAEQKEEWMLMAELNFHVENDHAQSIFATDEYWRDQRKNFSAKQIGEMPSWISEMKRE